MSDLIKYEKMRDAGASPLQVHAAAKADGIKHTARMALVRKVYGLSIAEAKEVCVIGNGLANSLSEYQEKLFSDLEQALNSEPGESRENGS